MACFFVGTYNSVEKKIAKVSCFTDPRNQRKGSGFKFEIGALSLKQFPREDRSPIIAPPFSEKSARPDGAPRDAY